VAGIVVRHFIPYLQIIMDARTCILSGVASYFHETATAANFLMLRMDYSAETWHRLVAGSHAEWVPVEFLIRNIVVFSYAPSAGPRFPVGLLHTLIIKNRSVPHRRDTSWFDTPHCHPKSPQGDAVTAKNVDNFLVKRCHFVRIFSFYLQ
jgi:hypothetical protein